MRHKIVKFLRKVTGFKRVQIDIPENEGFGDYSSNISMKMFSQFPISNFQFPIKDIKNPRILAEKIVEKLKKNKELLEVVEKIEVAGPGFINLWLSGAVLASELQKILKEAERYGRSKVGNGKTVLVEYSSPNIAKSFGIGHLRSTIIGQALYNLYKTLGYKTIGDNHLGDWGTQFGAILAQISNVKFQMSNLSIDKLEELYVEFNKKAQDDPKLWDEARGWFKKLEDGDEEARNIWKTVKEISLKEFDRIYKLLGVNIDNADGESFYEDKMQAVIEEVRQKGLTQKSEGAEIVEFPSTRSGQAFPPAILLKSDGTTTYYTRDLATIKFRLDEWNPDKIIYEVGSDQKLHFQQVFKTAEYLSWSKGKELVHVAHGLIRFIHGKMATRRGETVKLEDVLNEAIKRARKIIETSSTGRGLTNKQKEEVAMAVGIGAVKYFDLMHHPESDIIFDWEKMFVLEGNSAPYLQYTFARTQSVLAKSQIQNPKSKNELNLTFDISHLDLNDEELHLLRSFVHFPEVIEDAAHNYSPNLLCNYLFDLAQKFNNFYNLHRILPPERENGKWKMENGKFRLALTAGVGQILKNGLRILGIDTPQRM